MNVFVAISKVFDGNMLNPDNDSDQQVAANRASFLAKNGIDIKQTTRVGIKYDSDNYRRYYEVTEKHMGQGMAEEIVPADALITRLPNHALFLPVADCVGAVVFDPINNVLMLAHLGRHSLEQFGGRESVRFMSDHFGCDPKDLQVWLTPAPGPDVYPLYAFSNRSIKNVVFEQLQSAGINSENIDDNPADTSKDPDYFSHSEFLKGNRPTDGRYAIVAMMKND